MLADVIGKIRDQGSNFRHETAGLLPSLLHQKSISRTIYIGLLPTFSLLHSNKTKQKGETV